MSKGKKKDLQIQLNTQSELDDFLGLNGVKVIDVYSEWCGPCLSVEGTFRKWKIDLNDDLLLFGMACADKIESLSKYKGHSEPTFLFYGAKTLVDVVRGAEGPTLAAKMKEHLKKEHDALENGVERVEFTDTGSRAKSARAKSAKKDSPAADSPPIPKTFSFAMIKPTAVAEGHADAIFARIAEEGLKVATSNEFTLTAERAGEFYKEHEGKPFYENLVTYMSSGPIVAIVLSGEDTVKKWRQLIGPTNLEKARAEAPTSIRALYGTDGTANAVHGSDSPASAEREITFFFPEWAAENLKEAAPAPAPASAEGAQTSGGDEKKDDTPTEAEAAAPAAAASTEATSSGSSDNAAPADAEKSEASGDSPAAAPAPEEAEAKPAAGEEAEQPATSGEATEGTESSPPSDSPPSASGEEPKKEEGGDSAPPAEPEAKEEAAPVESAETAEQPAAEQPAAEQPAAEQPAAEQPAAEPEAAAS